MSVGTVRTIGADGAAGAIAALVGADGTASRPYAAMLVERTAPMRDLCDALHILCMLHGRHPGLFDYAKAHVDLPVAGMWLADMADAFTQERQCLAALVAAAGPLPSTPGQAESEAAVSAQRHALDTLGQSDRIGCAIGAAAALSLDWGAVRSVLDHAADRMGVDIPQGHHPDPMETVTVLEAIAIRPGIERAALFGAQQLLAQQRGLWDLLEARAAARDAS